MRHLLRVLTLISVCLYASVANSGQFDDHTFQVDDLNSIKDWWVAQGGSIDNYFYSDTATTGSDGALGNEFICLRDDVNQVYVGRSDVCHDRQMDGYSYIFIDQLDWSMGFPEDIKIQSDDMLGNTSQYWSGCFTLNEGWGGYSGGSCPTINDFADGQINYGYINRTLTNTAAINLALQDAGIEVTGYNYSWSIKNWDANYRDQGNGRVVADPFQVTLTIKDDVGATVFSKTYNYSFWISDWTSFSGEEVFQNPFDASILSEIELSISGQDLGYWAGYYGPEFKNPDVRLNYRMASNPLAEDTTVEDLLFDQMCSSDPLYDINCPGYNDALLAQMNPTQYDTSIVDTSSMGIDATSDPGLADIVDITGVSDPVASVLDPVLDPVAESINVDPAVAETVTNETATETVTTETSSSPAQQSTSPGKSGGLSANQQFALNQAEAASRSSEQTASEQSQSSEQAANEANSSATGMSSDGQMSETASTEMFGDMTVSLDLDGTSTFETFEVALADIVSTVLNEVQVPEIKTDNENKSIADEMNQEEESDLVASTDDNSEEDEKAAALGYNPNFSAYETPQMTDASFYQPKEIYEGQKNYDSPSSRFFNGASDVIHQQMVRQQYERN